MQTSTIAISESVRDHFERPRHVGSLDSDDPAVGTAIVGSPQRGVVIRLQIRLSHDNVIEAVRFKTYGCVSAIAVSSWLSERLMGATLLEAEHISEKGIVQSLSLPAAKAHCASLARQALQCALSDVLGRRSHPECDTRY